jgi:hypothetical protein
MCHTLAILDADFVPAKALAQYGPALLFEMGVNKFSLLVSHSPEKHL